MGAGLGMTEEGADTLVEFGRDDVLEAAGLLMGFGVFDGKSIGEEAFSQAVATDNVARAARSRLREADLIA